MLAGPHSQGGYVNVDASYASPKQVSFPVSYASFGRLAGCSSDTREWMLYNETRTNFTIKVVNAVSGIRVNWLSAGV